MSRRTTGIYSRVTASGDTRWIVRISVQGKLQRFAPHGGFPTKREAIAFLEDARASIRRGTFFPDHFHAEQPAPLSTLLEADRLRDATHPVKNRAAYRAFWLALAGDRDCRTLTPALLDEARRRLLHFAPQTQHHYLAYLRALLNLAKRDGLIDRSPFERVRLPAVHNERMRFYSPEEKRALLAALEPAWQEAAEFAALTGLRWGEQFRLKREQVKVGYLELPQTKARRPQVRILSARAQELVHRQLARHTSPWVYPNQTGGPLDYHNFRKRVWVPATKAAQVADSHWHDWRHTFASELAMGGQSDRTIAELMGHTNTQLVKRYAHLASHHLRQAVDSLARPARNAARSRPKTER